MDNTIRFYGYKHWTLEEVPRCFYIGKGLKKRPFETNRSRKWHAIVKRLGCRVEVCVGPISEDKAFQWETFNIIEENTFTNNRHHNDDFDIGCNFTYGGFGSKGSTRTLEQRRAMSEIQKITHNTLEVKEKCRQAHLGKKATEETREILRNAQRRPETKEKHRNSLLGIKRTPEQCENNRQAQNRPDVKAKISAKNIETQNKPEVKERTRKNAKLQHALKRVAKRIMRHLNINDYEISIKVT